MQKWFSFCLVCMVSSLFCKEVAYSPSNPGQPLIFHETFPAVSSFDRKVIARISPQNLNTLLQISAEGTQLSSSLLGLVRTAYLPLTPTQKATLSALYLADIELRISQIYNAMLTFNKGQGIPSLLRQTLLSFTDQTTQLLLGSTPATPNLFFQQKYLEMQISVINAYRNGLEAFTTPCCPFDQDFAAQSTSAITGLVSCLFQLITITNHLVFDDVPAKSKMVLAQQQISENLTIAIESACLTALMR